MCPSSFPEGEGRVEGLWSVEGFTYHIYGLYYEYCTVTDIVSVRMYFVVVF